MTTGRSTRAARRRSKAATPTTSPSTRSFIRATRGDIRAVNVNSIDEVPDSTWFTNRIGRRADDRRRKSRAVRTSSTSMSIDDWPIVQEKSSGITAGLSRRRSDRAAAAVPGQVRPAVESGDGQRRRSHRRRDLPRARLQRRPGLHRRSRSREDRHRPERDDRGHERPKASDDTQDVDRLLARGARLPNGKYRATLSRFADGATARLLQVLRHAPRRSQRHPSARASPRAARQSRIRRLAEPRRLARHQLARHARRTRRPQIHPPLHVRLRLDHGQRQHRRRRRCAPATSTSSSGRPRSRRWRPSACTCGRGSGPSTGRARSRWAGSRATSSTRSTWRPEYPNPAFDNMRAGRCVLGGHDWSRGSPTKPFARSSPRGATANPGAADHIATTLIKRRDKVAARLADRRQPACRRPA